MEDKEKESKRFKRFDWKTALMIASLVLVIVFIVLLVAVDWRPDCKEDMPWMAEVCR